MLIADEAKAIIDSLSEPEYAGGIGEVANALRSALEVVDLNTLVDYANRLGNKTLGSRLGYLLGLLGRPVAPWDGTSVRAHGHSAPQLIRSTSLVKLDPSRPGQGQRNTRWRLDVNLSSDELSKEGIG